MNKRKGHSLFQNVTEVDLLLEHSSVIGTCWWNPSREQLGVPLTYVYYHGIYWAVL